MLKNSKQSKTLSQTAKTQLPSTLEKATLVPASVINLSGKPTILCFGETPGIEDVQEGQAFAGRAGKLLRKLITLHLPHCRVVLDNVCPEVLAGGHGKPNADILKKYKAYREESVTTWQPSVIVLVGAYAMNTAGLRGTAGIVRRNATTVLYHGRPAVLSVHPAYVLRNPAEIKLLRRVCVIVEAELRGGKEVQAPRSRNGLTLNISASLDLETEGLNPRGGRILTAAMSSKKQTTWIAAPTLDTIQLSPKPVIFHNGKFDMAWLQTHGFQLPASVEDTLIIAWLIDENDKKDLGTLAQRYLGVPAWWLDIDLKHTTELPTEVLGKYNALDAHYTYQLRNKLWPELTKQQQQLCTDVLFPMTKLLAEMECRGFKVDGTVFEKICTNNQKLIKQQEKKLRSKYGEEINFRSTTDLKELVYGKLDYKVGGLTKAKQPAVDADTLRKISPKLADLADYRWQLWFESNVAKGWAKRITSQGFLHTNYNFGHVVTGRLSSSNPNMQNVDRDGVQRLCLVSRFPRGKIIQYDYKAHEYRIKAAEAGETKLLKQLSDSSFDPHEETRTLLRTKYEIVVDRPRAKNVNFSVIYGISPHGLFGKYEIPIKDGQLIIPAWYKLYPRIKAHNDLILKNYEEKREVESIFGWKRRFKPVELVDLGSRKFDAHQRNQALNFGTQNAAVVICYMGMLALDRWLTRHRMKSIIIHQIHDSVVVDAHPKEVKALEREVPEVLTNLKLPMRIPLAVEAKVGDTL